MRVLWFIVAEGVINGCRAGHDFDLFAGVHLLIGIKYHDLNLAWSYVCLRRVECDLRWYVWRVPESEVLEEYLYLVVWCEVDVACIGEDVERVRGSDSVCGCPVAPLLLVDYQLYLLLEEHRLVRVIYHHCEHLTLL